MALREYGQQVTALLEDNDVGIVLGAGGSEEEYEVALRTPEGILLVILMWGSAVEEEDA